MIRRFQIKIWNIRATNLTGETVDIFLQFLFGGDWRESLVFNKEKFKIKKEYGVMGVDFKSDVLDNLDPQ